VTGYTSGYGSFGIASIDAGITYISEAIRTRDLVEAAKNTFAEMPTQKVPVVSRFYSAGDSGQQARLLRGRYYSEVDRFIKGMQSAESSHRQACEAAEKSGDPMEMAKAISEFKAFAESERYNLYLDWKESAKEISKALKYFEAEDTPMLYRDAMQEMLDILND
jgi:hypothetical protein